MTRDQEGRSYEPSKPVVGLTFKDSKTRHGTPAGHTKHLRDGTEPCGACSMAKAHADWRWRQADDVKRKNRLTAKAQSRALQDLRRMHPEQYRKLYEAYRDAFFVEAGF